MIASFYAQWCQQLSASVSYCVGIKLVITSPPADKPIQAASRFRLPALLPMQIVACAPPTGPVEAAPLTDLALHIGSAASVIEAFWVGDEAYCVRVAEPDGQLRWFRISSPVSADCPMAAEEQMRLGALFATVLPLGPGRVAFPVGTSGRVVYRVWRSRGAGVNGRTKIRGVRAARSRRLPA